MIDLDLFLIWVGSIYFFLALGNWSKDRWSSLLLFIAFGAGFVLLEALSPDWTIGSVVLSSTEILGVGLLVVVAPLVLFLRSVFD